MSSRQGPRLADILAGNGGDFIKAFDATAPADDFAPLPSATYRCLLVDAQLDESRSGTLSYQTVWQVCDGEHRDRKLRHPIYLTAKSAPYARRDLAKLNLHSFADLRCAPPVGIVADLRVVVNSNDEGSSWNKVVRFEVVENGALPLAAFAPDDSTVTPDEPADDFLVDGEPRF
jgi:hypothetical protein